VEERRDAILFAAIERWWEVNRESLAGCAVAATLRGPFESPGMDPVYILHLESEGAESEAVLFRGGILLLQGFDKRAAKEIASSSVDAATEEALTAALFSLADEHRKMA
jgi:hypothetical protein